MKLSEELKWRGFVNQTTIKDLSYLDGKPISFYLGVDPSADSMTIGNLAAIMMVRHFINYGHKAFMLVGGATGLIGDPDGKESERVLKPMDEVSKNKLAIIEQYNNLFTGQDFMVVDNYDWFKDLGYLSFLRDIGKHVPMSQMLGRDFVKNRLGNNGSGISYAEFSYCLIQGYDFLTLYREYGVTLQLCGADQWGNSITGVDLIRRLENAETHVYSTPLVVNKSTGVKFGKSEGGAIWLDAKKTSVYKFYQFWLNLDDEGVIDYLKMYTMLSTERIEELEDALKNDSSIRAAQRALAHEVTTIVHGLDRAESVERVNEVLFGSGDFSSLSESDVNELANEIPVSNLGISLIDLLVTTSLASSKGDARRLIESGAVSLNGLKISEDSMINKRTLVKKGKNSFALVR